MPRTLSLNELNQFKANGFLPFDTGIAPAEVHFLRETLLSLHASNKGFKQGLLYDAMGLDDGRELPRFPQIMHPRAFAPALLKTEFYRLAANIARQVLGEGARFKLDISMLKPARVGAETPWHQDEAFEAPAFEYNDITFWLALQPVDESNGCMRYLPGSHTTGSVLPHGFYEGDARIHSLACTGNFDASQAVCCSLPTGGCVMHTQRTLHSAGPNMSDMPRLAYVLIFDVAPQKRVTPRVFPWQAAQHTARMARERTWRRRGGLLVHLWRQRQRLTDLRTFAFYARRIIEVVRKSRTVR